MKTKHIKLGMAAIAACLLAGVLAAAESKPRRAATQAFMKMKLTHSQGILEGMALERFDLISKNALRLRDMTASNHWSIMKQPEYMAHTTNYQKSIDSVYMAAVDKNLDAVTEAYAKVARNCVECHRLVRTEQRRESLQVAPGKTR